MEAMSTNNQMEVKVDMTPQLAPGIMRTQTAPVMLTTIMATRWIGHLMAHIHGTTAMEISRRSVLTSRELTQQLMATRDHTTARVNLSVLTLPLPILPTLLCLIHTTMCRIKTLLCLIHTTMCRIKTLLCLIHTTMCRIDHARILKNGTLPYQTGLGQTVIEAHEQSRKERSQLRICCSAMTLRLVPLQSLLQAGSLFMICF